MGYNFEVKVWDLCVETGYHWLQIYHGNSLIKAAYYMLWAKRHGWQCIKLEWRP